MSAKTPESLVFRKLFKTENETFRDHLLRLDRESRHMRFGHAVSDGFIHTYADVSDTLGGVVHGGFVGGTLRAAAELRPASKLAPDLAEAAFSVEVAYQNAGIGSELLRRTVLSARNRGVRRLVMYCMVENGRMRAVARKNEAIITIENGEVVGELTPANPSVMSMLREALTDTRDLFENAFDNHKRRFGGGT